MIAHHTSNGCNLRTGDICGTGTISGPSSGQLGSILEITSNGKHPVQILGEERAFLEDGDTVILTASCVNDGCKIGFGECLGTIKPSLE